MSILDWFYSRSEKLRGVGAVRSPRWSTVRDIFLKTHGSCAICGEMKGLNVHHIKPFHLFPESELDFNNLITLCREHHLEVGHLRSFYSYNLTIRQDAEVWRTRLISRP